MAVSRESPGLHCEGVTVEAASSLCPDIYWLLVDIIYWLLVDTRYWLLVDSRWYVDTGLLLCWHQLRWPAVCPALPVLLVRPTAAEWRAGPGPQSDIYNLHTDIYSIYALISSVSTR